MTVDRRGVVLSSFMKAKCSLTQRIFNVTWIFLILVAREDEVEFNKECFYFRPLCSEVAQKVLPHVEKSVFSFLNSFKNKFPRKYLFTDYVYITGLWSKVLR
jgi:hypothetical protein